MKSLFGFGALILACLLSCTVQAEEDHKPLSSQGTDCSQIKALSPQASSGVYVIQPHNVNTPFKVYCEMRPDGGWTVFQRRSEGVVSFNRKWEAYKNGFGNLTYDHWLGLQKVFLLTNNKHKKWTMRVDLWDHENNTAFAEYAHFRLGNEIGAFTLTVGNYRGTAGNAMQSQNHYGFSTSDRDNDGCSPCTFGDIALMECTQSDGGGWWYSNCGSASLNGDWHPAGDHIGWASGLHWETWKTPASYSLNATRMMLKSE